MKTKRWLYICAISLIAVSIACLLLANSWKPFFTIGIVILICDLPLLGVLLYFSYKSQKLELEKEFETYLVEEYNNGNITKEERQNPTKYMHDEFIKCNRSRLNYIIVIFLIVLALFMSLITFSINSLLG